MYCTWSVGYGQEYCTVHKVYMEYGCRQEYCTVDGVCGVGRSTVLYMECGVWAGVLYCRRGVGCGQEYCTVHKVYMECWCGQEYCTVDRVWGVGRSVVLYIKCTRSVGCGQEYCAVHGVVSVGRSTVLYMECWVWAGVLYCTCTHMKGGL